MNFWRRVDKIVQAKIVYFPSLSSAGFSLNQAGQSLVKQFLLQVEYILQIASLISEIRDEISSLRHNNSKGTQSLGAPTFFETYQLDPVLTVNIRENFPHFSGRGRGKITILKYFRASVFLNKTYLKEKLFLPETNLLGLMRT